MVLVGTLVVTVVLDLTFAIALGIIASTVLLLRRLMGVPVAKTTPPPEARWTCRTLRNMSKARWEAVCGRPAMRVIFET